MKIKRARLQSKEGAFEFAIVPVSRLCVDFSADFDVDFWRSLLGKGTAGRMTKKSSQNPSPKSSSKSQDICQSVLTWTLKNPGGTSGCPCIAWLPPTLDSG